MSEMEKRESEPALEQDAQEKAQEARKKRHRRRMQALRGFLMKLVSLALVLYILLFHLVGIMTMPNGDMYPRIDAGDLILFYRLERNAKAQDIVVIDKAVNTDFSVAGADSGEGTEENLDEEAAQDNTEAQTDSAEGDQTGAVQVPADDEAEALASETSGESENGTATQNRVSTDQTANAAEGREALTSETTGESDPDAASQMNGTKVQTDEKPWWRKVLTWLKIPDPDEPESTRFVCRVVAAPGDTVEIADGTRLIVNGNSMIETGIFYPTTEYVGFVDYPVTLGPDEYFVLADYRNGGADSRFFGPVKLEEIQGVVITILRRNNL